MREPPVEVTIFIALLALNGFGIWLLFRTLASYPAPAIRMRGLRRQARLLLLPKSRLKRWPIRARELRASNEWWLSFVPYVALAIVLWVPEALAWLGIDISEIYFGPFTGATESRNFLQTMWQVVAAAVGLSVAMIAFAFEVFITSAQTQFGGSLREFARRTHLLTGIRLGVLALLIDGAVLLDLGFDAPYGWAAMWATAISALTLIWVLVVLQLTILNLGRQRLLALRYGQLKEVVDSALRHQLLSQAAEVIIDGEPQIAHSWLGTGGGTGIGAIRDGVVTDIKLGPLARLAARRASSGKVPTVTLRAGLGEEVRRGGDVARLEGAVSFRERLAIMLAVRVGGGEREAPDRELTQQISRLNGIALIAIKERQLAEWRDIADLYEFVLLALPRAAAKLNIPFAGAVAAPGFFGYGPMQRVADNLYDEMNLALEVNDAKIVDAIAYLPLRIAREAAQLEAVAVAETMLALYPNFYVMAQRVRR